MGIGRYEFKREDALSFASFNHSEVKEKGGELWFRHCPYCGDSGDDWKFSINLSSGAFKCFRASCDKHGHFVELCRDLGYDLIDEKPVIYKQLPQRKVSSTDAALAYLEGRGISREVGKQYHITTRSDNHNVLVFPFYDEKGEMRFIKYRKMDFDKSRDKNKEWSETNTMPILFGMDQATDYLNPLIITEGQIDSLSVATAGIPNAVSVPTGASGFKWLTWCQEWIHRFPSIIVFGDHERGKITLVDTLRARLDDMRVLNVRPVDYLGEKDANDILRAYGTPAIIRAIEGAEEPKIDQIKPLDQVENVNINELPKIMTGIDQIDRVIGGMCVGQLILLTGKRGDGKSTFMSQVVANALDQGESVLAYSGELADFHFKRWLDYQLATSKNLNVSVNRYGDKTYDIPDSVEREITKWYSGRAFIYDNNYLPDDGSEAESLTSIIVKAIKKYNVRLICVDNLMTAMEEVRSQDNLYLAQSNFVGDLKKIALKYQVVIMLVAHPRKGNGKTGFDNDDVSGSSDVTNKVDIVMNYSRLPGADGNDDSEHQNPVHKSTIEITKNRLSGTLAFGKNAIRLYYSKKSKNISDNFNEKHYGWEHKPITETGEIPF